MCARRSPPCVYGLTRQTLLRCDVHGCALHVRLQLVNLSEGRHGVKEEGGGRETLLVQMAHYLLARAAFTP